MKNKKFYLLFRFMEVIAWILFCSLPLFFLKKPPHENALPAFQSIWSFIFIFFIKNIKFILFFYVHAKYLIPRFFEKKEHTKYIIYLSILFLIVAGIPFLVEFFSHHGLHEHHHSHHEDSHKKDLHHEFSKPHGFMPMMDLGMHFFMTIIVLIIPFLLHIYKSWVASEKEKTDMELSFLKSQINHHFIFNSLNSIYSLSVQESTKTPNAVHDLSFIMRYVLDETVKEKTQLNIELEYIEHYISLQRIRLNEKVTLQYEVKGTSDNLFISPMILIPFIENCFKHGLSTVQDCAIKISIFIENNSLVLKTENNIMSNLNNTDIISGIGIINVLKRLEHDYAGKYTYSKSELDNKYFVELKLILA